MIGIVIVSHGNIGCEMVNATNRIIPDLKHMSGVAIESDDPPQSIRHQIEKSIKDVDDGDGVLILTDMFGGTPSNICLSFLDNSKTEVISGFNMPMLIKLAHLKDNADFDDTVSFIQQYGQRNIVIASHVLSGRKRNQNIGVKDNRDENH
ncbi:MAG: PTS fructose transporter subunit IIA [Deltaproteobacteria bacterium]|jgi:mannose PTS system EIIA component|nr:PTS fructose transporter subunit IIA [Deltaproteobacteria bacterium]